jgi:hypothetical protein
MMKLYNRILYLSGRKYYAITIYSIEFFIFYFRLFQPYLKLTIQTAKYMLELAIVISRCAILIPCRSIPAAPICPIDTKLWLVLNTPSWGAAEAAKSLGSIRSWISSSYCQWRSRNCWTCQASGAQES